MAGIKNFQTGSKNPQELPSQADRVIRGMAIQQLVDGTKNRKHGAWYEMTEWVEVEASLPTAEVRGLAALVIDGKRSLSVGAEVDLLAVELDVPEATRSAEERLG